MVVLIAAILLWMADLQLFGRAPMAAFNGDDAAQSRKRNGMERRVTLMSSFQTLFTEFLQAANHATVFAWYISRDDMFK